MYRSYVCPSQVGTKAAIPLVFRLSPKPRPRRVSHIYVSHHPPRFHRHRGWHVSALTLTNKRPLLRAPSHAPSALTRRVVQGAGQGQARWGYVHTCSVRSSDNIARVSSCAAALSRFIQLHGVLLCHVRLCTDFVLLSYGASRARRVVFLIGRREAKWPGRTWRGRRMG